MDGEKVMSLVGMLVVVVLLRQRGGRSLAHWLDVSLEQQDGRRHIHSARSRGPLVDRRGN